MRTIGAVFALLLAGGCSATNPPPLESLTIAAGRDGGVYYYLAKELAAEAQRLWKVPARVLETHESIENLRKLDSGEADVGFVTLDAGMAARRGEPPFNGAIRVHALAGIYVDYLHVVVREDSGITTLRELANHRVSMGPEGSGLRIVAARVIGTIPIPNAFRIGLAPAEAAVALRTGEIDAFFVLGGLPTPLLTELDDQLRIRVLPVVDEFPRLRDEFAETYLLRTIPKGVYGLDRAVLTLGVPNALVVRSDLPDETARRLTELLFAARPSLAKAYGEMRHFDHRSAIATIPMPLHPGAERYYRETKPMIDRP